MEVIMYNKLNEVYDNYLNRLLFVDTEYQSMSKTDANIFKAKVFEEELAKFNLKVVEIKS